MEVILAIAPYLASLLTLIVGWILGGKKRELATTSLIEAAVRIENLKFYELISTDMNNRIQLYVTDNTQLRKELNKAKELLAALEHLIFKMFIFMEDILGKSCAIINCSKRKIQEDYFIKLKQLKELTINENSIKKE